MGLAAANALERRLPAWTCQTWDAEIFARGSCNPPARDRRRSLGHRVDLRCASKHKGRNTRSLGGELEPLGGCRRIFGDLADDARNACVTQTLFHCEQYVGVVACLDVNDAVRVQ